MGTVVPSSNQSSSVYAPIFVAHDQYSCKNACLWGIFKAHVDVVLGRDQKTPQPLINRVIHLVLAALELLPILGQIVSLVEYTIEHILHSRREQQIVNKHKQHLSTLENKSKTSSPDSPCTDVDFTNCLTHLNAVLLKDNLVDIGNALKWTMKLHSDRTLHAIKNASYLDDKHTKEIAKILSDSQQKNGKLAFSPEFQKINYCISEVVYEIEQRESNPYLKEGPIGANFYVDNEWTNFSTVFGKRVNHFEYRDSGSGFPPSS